MLRKGERRGTFPIFLSDVKARHNKMIGLVEMMMTADGLRLTAYRPDKDRIRFVEGTAGSSRRTADGLRLADIWG